MFSQEPKIAKRWAKETPDFKSLPEQVKKKALKKILKDGKGGFKIPSLYSEASKPINLLKQIGTPPTASKIPKSENNK
jgi:hypothetical protein